MAASKGTQLIRVLGYLVLFLAALLVFDSFSLALGVGFGLWALDFFVSRRAQRSRY